MMRKRGRPPKFNRPSRLVAMTLPEDVIKALRARHVDLARAVVALLDEAKGHATPRRLGRRGPAELAEIAPRRYLITVDVNAVRVLPGCELVPITPTTAFLALQPGCGLADLALAVTDRLEEKGLDEQEREGAHSDSPGAPGLDARQEAHLRNAEHRGDATGIPWDGPVILCRVRECALQRVRGDTSADSAAIR